MKIAILSDIHGIWPALNAVVDHIDRWQPDQVVVNGDIVNRGPYSDRCWDLLVEREAQAGWQLLFGNHEGYIVNLNGDRESVDAYGYPLLSTWTARQLGSRTGRLPALPKSLTISAPDDSQLYITHASRRHDRDGIIPWRAPDTIREQIAPAPAVFATAHIHFPFVVPFEETCIVNSGSVGTPVDGNTQASYAQVSWTAADGWGAVIARVDYDRAQAERDFHESGFLLQGNPFARLIYHEWRQARPLLLPWSRQYHDAVVDGLVSLNWAVDQFLAAI